MHPLHNKDSLEGKPKDSVLLKNMFCRDTRRVKRCRRLACSCYKKTEVANLPHTDGRPLEYKNCCNSIYFRLRLVSLRECSTIGLNIDCLITMSLVVSMLAY